MIGSLIADGTMGYLRDVDVPMAGMITGLVLIAVVGMILAASVPIGAMRLSV